MSRKFALTLLIGFLYITIASGGVFWECEFPGLVSLTFDDGPSPQVTRQVLDVLKEYNLTTTFFINGYCNQDCNETRYRETIQRAFNEGHQIGSHSWSHYDMTNLTVQEIRSELKSLSDLVSVTLGVNMTVFRPPYGEFDDQLIRIAEEEFGYDAIIWNVDTNDWQHPSDVDAGFQEWVTAIEAQNYTSFIGLQHDWTEGAPVLLREIINFVHSFNYTIVPIYECIGGQKYRPINLI